MVDRGLSGAKSKKKAYREKEKPQSNPQRLEKDRQRAWGMRRGFVQGQKRTAIRLQRRFLGIRDNTTTDRKKERDQTGESHDGNNWRRGVEKIRGTTEKEGLDHMKVLWAGKVVQVPL